MKLPSMFQIGQWMPFAFVIFVLKIWIGPHVA